MKKYKFKVEISVKPPLDEQACREFIEEALTTWGGQYHPLSPEWEIGDRIVVRRLVQKTGKRT